MKINEIILEVKKGKLHKYQKSALNRNQKFSSSADRFYDLNRVMMAAACSDGKNSPEFLTRSESWLGKSNLSFPYSPEEQGMIDHAYQAVGCDSADIVTLSSREPDDTHKVSPTPARMKNKYGV